MSSSVPESLKLEWKKKQHQPKAAAGTEANVKANAEANAEADLESSMEELPVLETFDNFDSASDEKLKAEKVSPEKGRQESRSVITSSIIKRTPIVTTIKNNPLPKKQSLLGKINAALEPIDLGTYEPAYKVKKHAQ
jgi:hypothetical protein